LHTYSSLNLSFLPQYKGSLSEAPHAFVYFNPHAIKLKKLKPVTKDEVKKAFGDSEIVVSDNSSEMFSFIEKQNFRNVVYLFMSSGNFDGINSMRQQKNYYKPK
jgi:UDP-N-acetylmuramate: L-alanyl-gamma-D-glutamyl-meso-diaminopimelate ligase